MAGHLVHERMVWITVDGWTLIKDWILGLRPGPWYESWGPEWSEARKWSGSGTGIVPLMEVSALCGGLAHGLYLWITEWWLGLWMEILSAYTGLDSVFYGRVRVLLSAPWSNGLGPGCRCEAWMEVWVLGGMSGHWRVVLGPVWRSGSRSGPLVYESIVCTIIDVWTLIMFWKLGSGSGPWPQS